MITVLSPDTLENWWLERDLDYDRTRNRLPDIADQNFRNLFEAHLEFRAGHNAQALHRLEQCRSALPDGLWRARAINLTAIVLAESGLYRQAQQYFHQQLEIVSRLQNPLAVRRTYLDFGVFQLKQNFRESERLLNLALDEAVKYQDQKTEMEALFNLAVLHLNHGLIPEFSGYVEALLLIPEEVYPAGHLMALAFASEQALQQGDLPKAQHYLQEIQQRKVPLDLKIRGNLAILEARIEAHQGHFMQAVTLLEAFENQPLGDDLKSAWLGNLIDAKEAVGEFQEALGYARQLAAFWQRMSALGRDEYLRMIEVMFKLEELRSELSRERRRADDLEVFVRQIQDVSRLIEEKSNRDYLTGLYNRRYLLTGMTEIIERLFLRGRLYLAMMDVDILKTVNDTYGHDAGDHLLREFSNALTANLAPDMVGVRYGGDEFVVIGYDPPEKAFMALIQAFQQDFATRMGTRFRLPITASVGITLLEPDGLDAALHRADQLMYQAKRAGGNTIQVG